MNFSSIGARRESVNPLVRALCASLAIHLLLFGTLELGKHSDWWETSPLLRWVRKNLLISSRSYPPPKPVEPQVERELPLIFVDVDPDLADPEPPPETKYYSALNSKAANPDIAVDSNQPKIDGNQTRIPKTFDTFRPQPIPPPPQPTSPVEKQEPQRPETPPAPETGPAPGDLAMAKPQTKPALDDTQPRAESNPSPPPRLERPRTLAAARQQKGIVVTEKMKQEGGVRRQGAVSLNVKGTPFGAYDAAIVAAVQTRWFALLDERRFASDGVGRVILEFRLNEDGRVTDMKTTESDVGELLALLCQKAVLDPAPYERWPADMRRLVGASFREVRFTFYYN